MSIVMDGFGASEGIGLGPVRVLAWGVPEVSHETIAKSRIDREVVRLPPGA